MKYIVKMTSEHREELTKLMEEHSECIKSLVREVSYNCGRTGGRDMVIAAVVAGTAGALVGTIVERRKKNKAKTEEDK